MPEYKHYAPAGPVLGLAQPGGYRIKQYAITYGGGPFRDADFAAGLRLAVEGCPSGREGARPGVGFAIAHQGNGADYTVLGWWDNENELPLRVVVRPQTPDGTWRPAGRRVGLRLRICRDRVRATGVRRNRVERGNG